MNSSSLCHEIEDCPGLYVDAFRVFASNINDSGSSFILTHYHGDHYSGLPKEGKYNGPALIHCTPVTAALLRNVHQVPPQFVREHEYGATWNHKMDNGDEAFVTFYDANHCPGAAIVLVELPDGTAHLHCGDMRYHEKMKTYESLNKAVEERRVGVVYLDTTYGHPKHDLVPQHVAVETIASLVESVMDEECGSNTLILLSCYSIGKEKVLWEASKRANQLIYISERKREMLACIQGYDEDASSQILTRCTLDSTKSDIHVIPMGMAGEMWPFFRPNYRACVDYVEKLDKRYDKVVAFLPTGWADSSNWNKKNAVNSRRMDLKERDGHVDIEIRLVCYSEHSAFPELYAFVEYLRPRQVVPTVFADDNDYRKIESRFRKLVDTSRAKEHFLKSMKMRAATSNRLNEKRARSPSERVEAEKDVTQVVDVDASNHSEGNRKKPKSNNSCSEHVDMLVAMGFDAECAQTSLTKCHGNVETALDDLLRNQKPVQTKSACIENASNGKRTKQSPRTIKSFFSPKSKVCK